MALSGIPQTPGLVTLIKKEQFVITDVLLHSGYQGGLRNSLPTLINYLLKSDTINDLLDWTITPLYSSHDK
jgi:hypothetical protein